MKRTLFWLLLLLLAGSLGVAACSQQSGEPQPPEIVYGQDVCDRCGMLIGEPRFASATLLKNGEYLKFDDTGEMIRYHLETGDDQVRAWFVHDYGTSEWLRGEQAFFVLSSDLLTPMGTGIVAFTSQESAEKFAAENFGTIYTLKDLQTYLKSQSAIVHTHP